MHAAGLAGGRRAVVTGAFSYVGSAIAREIVRRGWTVHTLTNRTIPPGEHGITAASSAFPT